MPPPPALTLPPPEPPTSIACRAGHHLMSSEQEEQLRAPVAMVFPMAGRMPLVGLGTWTQRQAGEVEAAVTTAIR